MNTNKKTIACFFGGCSSEYEVSLVSATSVIRSMNKEKYNVLFIGITQEGNFYLYDGPIEKIEKNAWYDTMYCKKVTISTNRMDKGIILLEPEVKIIPIDLAFPILHGANGEDGRLQGLLELAGIPYVGCDMESSAICMDKFVAHELVEKNGILTPQSYLFHKEDSLSTITKKIENLALPIFVKPLRAGSSFGVTKVCKKSELQEALTKAFQYDEKIVIEQGIDGFEVGCAILGNKDLIIGEVDEIELQDGFFDYEEKYTLKTSKIHCPARLPQEVREEIKKQALEIYRILGCRGFARVDLFYTKDKKIVFNEVNTIPGCTSHSRYPSMLKQIGYPFEKTIEKLIELGLE